ncbi:Fe(3+) ABC transporter substrate-binding protein [Paraglaciecola aquimarina]|uniref:Fe(3+) ABC transporter substrate-binding protein n=1 Tax=Paraglaciecola algarum TaxID=3050085 RepID=A0ABS9D1B3_9ALTE|nr:Fe(3+) ABC transporter substrate-binding protein [Paraglaciecola sp. G1-23]MCF2946711.1 Fe(3+) ABC transporter substrate-binding protein [Paraglaciecola sp. G1-23]
MKNILSIVALVGTFVSPLVMAEQVNLYSARKEALIKPLLDQFTQQTGISVNLVTGKADNLITRLKSEGKYSPADLLLTTDVGRLYRAKQQGLTQAISTSSVSQTVPANFQDEESHWIGLSLRARPIMVSKDRVAANAVTSLEDLTDPSWKGRICIRSSSNIYNQSMVASLIAQLGEEQAQAWVDGFVKNFARPPQGGDRDQIKAVAAGQCDLAIANTYYLAGMLSSDDKTQQAQAKQVKVVWPNQQDRGAHVNISGVAMAKNAPNKDAARKLVDFLLSSESQVWYANTNHEYPVLPNVKWSDLLTSFGQYKAEQVPLSQLGELNASAVRIMDRAGWK